jgi:hypothetical protein
MPNARENDKNEWIQVKYKNCPNTKLTSPVKNVTIHNAYGILSQSDNPILDNNICSLPTITTGCQCTQTPQAMQDCMAPAYQTNAMSTKQKREPIFGQ